MGRFIDAPKALLPLWLLAAIVLAGTAAGCAVGGWPGVVVAGAVSWPLAMLARRELARRGRTGFEDLPSADYDYNDSFGLQSTTELAYTAAALGAGAAIGALVAQTGLGDGEVIGLPVWLVCGWVAAAPVVHEVDARIGLWARRRRLREEERIEQAADEPEPLADEPGEPVSGDVVTVPLKRGTPLRWGLGGIAAGIASPLIGLFGDDVSGFEQVVLIVCGPLFVGVGVMFLRFLRRPYFLRLTPGGADLLGAGEIPWDAIESADVVSHSRGRWFALALTEPLADQPWATPEVRKLAKRSGGDDVEAMLKLSDWPAERLAAAVRRAGPVEVEAYLA